MRSRKAAGRVFTEAGPTGVETCQMVYVGETIHYVADSVNVMWASAWDTRFTSWVESIRHNSQLSCNSVNRTGL